MGLYMSVTKQTTKSAKFISIDYRDFTKAMNLPALCALFFFVFSVICQAADPGDYAALKATKLEQLKALQTSLATATQEQNFAEVKRITAELNKVVAELDGMKAPEPAKAPAAQPAKISPTANAAAMKAGKIGRASCRERVSTDV